MQSISGCHRDVVIYNGQVRLNWKLLRLTLAAVLPLVGTGCGGVNASHSVSPASFLLPGLMKNDAPTNLPTLLPVISNKNLLG